ncbi:ankyrin repeat-containing domain, PGG domain protein [Tanacetum coccineum]
MDTMEKLLYEASLEGNTIALLELLQDDPLILDRLTLNRHGDMPLHIASMLGHVTFVNEILTRKPHLAMECDSLKHLPLHIASAKGHVEIVKSLVSANPKTCLARDRDGGTPLHLAAIKGRSDVVISTTRIN